MIYARLSTGDKADSSHCAAYLRLAARFHYRWPPADHYAMRALDRERHLFFVSLMIGFAEVEI